MLLSAEKGERCIDSMKRSSMADVARLAGVSTATVSHVINRSRFVSPEVTKRVTDAIQALNYVPNQIARNLKTGHNNTVLFVLPDITNSYFATAIEAVEGVLMAANYRLVIANTKENFARETVHLQSTANSTVDGLILASTAECWEQASALIPAGLPTVLVDRVFGTGKSSVSSDSSGALQRAVELLAGDGHRRIGFISGIARLSSTRERLHAYQEAMARCGLPIEDGFIQPGDSMRGSSPQCYRALLAEGCTAVVVSNGVMTMDVIGYRMQQEDAAQSAPAIVGYVDSPLQPHLGGCRATICLPTEELGRHAGEEILRLIRDPAAAPRTLRLPAQLLVSAP